MAEKLFSKEKKDVVLLGLAYDETSSYAKGSDKGPQAVLNSFDTQLELYNPLSGWSPARRLGIHQEILDLGPLKTEEMISSCSKRVSEILSSGQFLVCIGGEHSLTTGILTGYKEHVDPKKITVLQIDAHMDLRDDDGDYNENPSRFAHSTVMRRVHEMGFAIVQVGVRAFADFELDYAKNNEIPCFTWPRKENEELIDEIMNAIPTDEIYITLDADGIDPAHMPGTGTPVQGGLSWLFVRQLLKKAILEKKLIGADIVEVLPQSCSVLTEFGAAELAYSMIGLRFKE